MPENTQNEPNRRQSTLNRILLWILLGLLAGLMTLLLRSADRMSERDLARQWHATMTEQMQEVKSGKIDCLVDPNSKFFDELLADSTYTTNLATVYLTNDVSDPRLARLRELPNLKSIVFLWMYNSDIVLECLHGATTIEYVSFDRCAPSRKGIEHIASLPNLKSLGLPMRNLRSDDFESLKNHAALERLTLTRAKCDKQLVPILKGLPHLKQLNMKVDYEEGNDPLLFSQLLHEALPHCKCTVREVEGR